jgi:hypothetical protein
MEDAREDAMPSSLSDIHSVNIDEAAVKVHAIRPMSTA